MEKNVGLCDVSVFVSKSKFAEVKRTIENLGIQEVVMPRELVDILLKVYRERVIWRRSQSLILLVPWTCTTG